MLIYNTHDQSTMATTNTTNQDIDDPIRRYLIKHLTNLKEDLGL